MKTIVVMPTYNEVGNIRPMAGALMALDVPGLSLLVVDDNSPDGTAAAVDELGREYPGRVSLLRRAGKQGLGTAYKAGFHRALADGADVVVQMDADFSHSPQDVPRLVGALAAHDVAIGSRYARGGSLDESWGAGRHLLSWWANAVYTRLILGTRQRDTTSGFRAWRRDTLQGLNLERIRSNSYDFMVEMTYVAERLGYRVVELPIHFSAREAGESKMGLAHMLQSALCVWRIRAWHRALTPAERHKGALPSAAH